MTTVVNNPAPSNADASSGGNSFLLGVILLIIFAVVFIFYILPRLTNVASNFAPPQAPQVNVPGKVDVNVHNQK